MALAKASIKSAFTKCKNVFGKAPELNHETYYVLCGWFVPKSTKISNILVMSKY